MNLSMHGKLVRILDPVVERAEFNSHCSEPILVEHVVAIGLHVLARGMPKDNRHIIESSKADACVVFDNFIDTMNTISELDIHLPQTQWLELNA